VREDLFLLVAAAGFEPPPFSLEPFLFIRGSKNNQELRLLHNSFDYLIISAKMVYHKCILEVVS